MRERLSEGHEELDVRRGAAFDKVSDSGAAHSNGVVRKMKEGFGFIAGNDGIDYFFHWTSLQKTSVKFAELEIGDRVEFTRIEAPKGPRAIEVRKLS